MGKGTKSRQLKNQKTWNNETFMIFYFWCKILLEDSLLHSQQTVKNNFIASTNLTTPCLLLYCAKNYYENNTISF